MQAMELFYREYGEARAPVVIILHGLFGMSDNWASYGKLYGRHYRVIIPDLRNHGRSPHSENFSYELMMSDLELLFHKLRIDKALLLGHSMGGKLAMNFALHQPQCVRGLIIADMSMKEGEFSDLHAAILNAIARTDLSHFSSFADIQQALEKIIPQKRIVLFAMKNIKRNEQGSFEYKLNYHSLYNNAHKIMEAVLCDKTCPLPALFIRGGKSNYVNDEDFKEIKQCFTQARLADIANASHWVHADNIPAFTELSLRFMEEVFSKSPT